MSFALEVAGKVSYEAMETVLGDPLLLLLLLLRTQRRFNIINGECKVWQPCTPATAPVGAAAARNFCTAACICARLAGSSSKRRVPKQPAAPHPSPYPVKYAPRASENDISVILKDDDIGKDDTIGNCRIQLARVRQAGRDQQQVPVLSRSGKQHGFLQVTLTFTKNSALQVSVGKCGKSHRGLCVACHPLEPLALYAYDVLPVL